MCFLHAILWREKAAFFISTGKKFFWSVSFFRLRLLIYIWKGFEFPFVLLEKWIVVDWVNSLSKCQVSAPRLRLCLDSDWTYTNLRTNTAVPRGILARANDKTPVNSSLQRNSRVIPVEAESVCPICSRGIPESDDHSGSDAAGWPDLLHNKVETTTP